MVFSRIANISKGLMVLVMGIIGLVACEKDEPVEPREVSYKARSDQSDCLFLLGDIGEGMVLKSRQRYDRLVDSVNFETTPFPCEPEDLDKGWDFEQYDYLVYQASVGGCSAQFSNSLRLKSDTLQMTVTAKARGLCAKLIGSNEVLRIPAATDYKAVTFKTEEVQVE